VGNSGGSGRTGCVLVGLTKCFDIVMEDLVLMKKRRGREDEETFCTFLSVLE